VKLSRVDEHPVSAGRPATEPKGSTRV
jgi:hypothetical protein